MRCDDGVMGVMRAMIDAEWMLEPVPGRVVGWWNGWAVPAFASADDVVRVFAGLGGAVEVRRRGDVVEVRDLTDGEVYAFEPDVEGWYEVRIGWTFEVADA